MLNSRAYNRDITFSDFVYSKYTRKEDVTMGEKDIAEAGFIALNEVVTFKHQVCRLQRKFIGFFSETSNYRAKNKMERKIGTWSKKNISVKTKT